MSSLNHKEVVIMNRISKKSSISQRELAKITGISLGLINVILRKIEKGGYVRVEHVNKRKMEYHLTPLGSQETAKKNHENAIKTINSYKAMTSSLAKFLRELHASGYDYFSIHGDGELRNLLESVFRGCLEEAPVSLGKDYQCQPRAVVLNVSYDPVPPVFKGNVVNILEKIGI